MKISNYSTKILFSFVLNSATTGVPAATSLGAEGESIASTSGTGTTTGLKVVMLINIWIVLQ